MRNRVRSILYAIVLCSFAPSAQAYSFYGNDWQFSQSSRLVITLNSLFGGSTQTIPDTAVNQPKTVTQTVTNQFQFPLSISNIDGVGDFSVDGTVVTDTNSAGTTPWQTVGTLTLRAVYPTFLVRGNITGVNSNPLYDDSFGSRAYEITGIPSTITGIVIQAQTGFGPVTAGSGVVHIDSWSLSRSPVPEPTSMLALGLGTAAMLKRRKVNA